jgi:hypothetical protein
MSSVWPGANWASAGIAKSRLPARRAHLTETKYSRHNPETDLSAFVIPQVPGAIARSTPVDGVIESLVKSKKYVLPRAYVNPWVTGSLVAVYFGGGRFHPDPHAAVFNPMVNAEAGVTMVRSRVPRRWTRQWRLSSPAQFATCRAANCRAPEAAASARRVLAVTGHKWRGKGFCSRPGAVRLAYHR